MNASIRHIPIGVALATILIVGAFVHPPTACEASPIGSLIGLTPVSISPFSFFKHSLGAKWSGGLGGLPGLEINDEALGTLFGLHAVMKATSAFLKLKHFADKQWAPYVRDLNDVKIGHYEP